MTDLNKGATCGTEEGSKPSIWLRLKMLTVSRLGPGLVTGAADDDPSGVMMVISMNPRLMGRLTLPLPMLLVGWLATVVMAAASIGLFVL